MSPKPHDPAVLRVSQISQHGATPVELAPDAAARAELARWLGLIRLPRLHFRGRIVPAEGGGLRLTARLEAEVIQPCVVTLAPVATSIDQPVTRHWSPYFDPAASRGEAGEEVEMVDDEIEPLGSTLDLGAVMREELSLALPPWPRAKGVALPAEARAADPDEATRRPFAGLGDLLRKRE